MPERRCRRHTPRCCGATSIMPGRQRPSPQREPLHRKAAGDLVQTHVRHGGFGQSASGPSHGARTAPRREPAGSRRSRCPSPAGKRGGRSDPRQRSMRSVCRQGKATGTASQPSLASALTGAAIHAGMVARAAASSAISSAESRGATLARASSTSRGPNHAKARTASPARRYGATSCQRGAWRSRTVCLPKRNRRSGPEVR